MNTIKSFFVKPFTAKGIFWGMVDLLVKAVALCLWVYLVVVLGSVLALSFRIDYNFVTILWWCAYCFIIFFGASLLCYIACFVRDYNEVAE